MEFIKEYLPRTSADGVAMIITFFSLPAAFLHGIFYVTPNLYPLDDRYSVEEQQQHIWWRNVHYLIMTYTFIIVTTDLFLTLLTEPSCQKLTLPNVPQPGWVHCPYCQKFVPPRTHHCLTCSKCVLRRDHHCFFVGRCVGYQNHKYFMLFLFHTFISTLYALILSIKLVFFLSDGFSWIMLGAAIFPVMAWTLQLITVNPYMLMATSASFLFMCLSLVLLIMHSWHLYKGQTFWEATRGVPQPKGWIKNARDVLGCNWWLTWICPFIPSPLPNDGTHYSPKEEIMETKQVKGRQQRRKRI